MMDKIINYLMNEKKSSEKVAKTIAEKFQKHDDIKTELIYWLDNRIFKDSDLVFVEGYNAKSIMELNPKFDVIGAYSYLISLRDNPQQAKKFIEEGFILK